MRELYFYIGEHVKDKTFKGIVRAHSTGVNIEYHNDDPVIVEIMNIRSAGITKIISKTALLIVQNERPLRAELKGLINYEAAKTLIIA